MQTPRRLGFCWSAADLDALRLGVRPLRTSWLIVGTAGAVKLEVGIAAFRWEDRGAARTTTTGAGAARNDRPQTIPGKRDGPVRHGERPAQNLHFDPLTGEAIKNTVYQSIPHRSRSLSPHEFDLLPPAVG